MKPTPILATLAIILSGPLAAAELEPPRVESVQPLEKQPQEDDKATIWYDDFNAATWKKYKEKGGELDDSQAYGDGGRSLKCFYAKGQKGTGNAKVFFGDNPYGAMTRKGEKFKEIFVRIYVRHQDGWHGGHPAKMFRATSMVPSHWSQAMIAHVWGSDKWGKDVLTLDPVRAVSGSTVLTKKYNDWKGLKWLGNSPRGTFPIASTKESGVWYCVEMGLKLNSAGESDGTNHLWIDGRLDAERQGMNFIGTYTKHTINAVFLEAYWNKGAPADLSRWYDNFAISSKRIGFMYSPANPVITRANRPWEKKSQTWECEIADGADGKNVVYKSKTLKEESFTVDEKSGKFAKGSKLAAGTYYCRARQQAGTQWSEWSHWHQGFTVAD